MSPHSLEVIHKLIGGKWKIRILWHIIHGENRFSILKKVLGDISEKVLYTNLKELESNGIIYKEIVKKENPAIIYYHIRKEHVDLVNAIEKLHKFTKKYNEKMNEELTKK